MRSAGIKPFEPKKVYNEYIIILQFEIEREVKIPEENIEKKMKFNMIVVAGRKMSD